MQQELVPIFVRILAEECGLASRNVSFADLANHALAVLATREGKSEIVCGPITTGGLGEAGRNILLFNHAIELLQKEGRPMFNQVPYEYPLARLEREWKKRHGSDVYCHPILAEFYLPIFRSGHVGRAWFLPGWKTSKGATWEHEELSRLGCKIEYLPERWLYELDVRHI